MVRAVILAAVSVGAATTYGFSHTNTIESVVGASNYWDGRHVKVSGKIENLEERTALNGRSYDVISLCDSMCIRVFIDGRPKLTDGQRFTVEGIFSAAKRMDMVLLPNDIQADAE